MYHCIDSCHSRTQSDNHIDPVPTVVVPVGQAVHARVGDVAVPPLEYCPTRQAAQAPPPKPAAQTGSSKGVRMSRWIGGSVWSWQHEDAGL